MSKNACRQYFANELIELASTDKDIVVICSDSRGSCSMTDFSNTYPEQFIEAGIAEQNEVGMAAGLANVGYKPFVCAPASFLSARSLEQVKVDVAYSKKNVVLFGVSGGISYGALGYTHHSTHDIAVMRTIPNLNVVLPSDAIQAASVARYFSKNPMPLYIRVGRGPVEDIYSDWEGEAFTLGQANELMHGDDITIIACGEMTYPALQAAKMLQKENISVRVLDSPSISPIDENSIIKAAKETKAILTIEEHCVNNGLGSAVSSLLSEQYPVPMKIMGLPYEILINGSSEEVKDEYKLNTEGIIDNVYSLLKRK